MKDAFEKDGKMSVNPTLWTAYKNYKTPVDNRVQSGFTGPATFYLLEADMSVYTSEVRDSYALYGDAAIVVFGVLFAGSAALLTVQTYFRKEENLHE